MSKTNSAAKGGDRAERISTMRKPLFHFWGWMSAKALLCLSLEVHKFSPKVGCFIITRHKHTNAMLPQCRMLPWMHSESWMVFLLQDICEHRHD